MSAKDTVMKVSARRISEQADELAKLRAELAAERKRSDALIGALEQFANNNLSEANCGSVELAGRRVANIARVALDTARRK